MLDALVVEDNPVNQMVMTKVLEQYRLRYLITPSGDEALEIWRGSLTHIPLIFMDVEIEGTLDGLEVTREIRRLESERDHNRIEAGFPAGERSYIAVMTGRALDSDRLEALERGCDEFITKPVDLDGIRQIIQTRLPPRN